MANTKETVIIKIENLSGYLQGLIKGLSKNPNEGYSVMATFEKDKAKRYEKDSEDLNEVLGTLNHNHVNFELIED